MQTDKFIGRVLWWSEKDENGIILDANGNEFYFDRSVLKNIVKHNDIVEFNKNYYKAEKLWTAKNVELCQDNMKKIIFLDSILLILTNRKKQISNNIKKIKKMREVLNV